MDYSHYERLSALDDSFLEIEDANSHMHIGAVALFESGPLRTPESGIDRIRALMEAQLHRIPRYRQRLERVPLFRQPVWVDDVCFNYGDVGQRKLLDTLVVKEVMTTTVLTTSPQTRLGEAARLMLDRKIGCLPGMEDGRLVGILTEGDFVRACVS